MKLSELIKQMESDEYSVPGILVFIYLRKNGSPDILKQVQNVEDDIRVVSNPPSGKSKVTNIYWDPIENKVAVEFDNTLV